MPYLIEKSCGTRTPVDMTADEARYKAQSVRVIEIAADGAEIGDVAPVSEGFEEVGDRIEQTVIFQGAPVTASVAAKDASPAAKKAAKAKK